MKLKEILIRITVFLFMLGFFGCCENNKAFAEEWNAIDFTQYGEEINFNVTDKVVYKLTPKKTGVYLFKLSLYSEDDPDDLIVNGTVYNSDKEYIVSLVQNTYGERNNYVYLCKGKTYYVVIEKSDKLSSVKTAFFVDYLQSVVVPEKAEIEVGIGENVIPISKANIKGLSYDANTQTLEINNYNGSDEIKIISPLIFEADEKDYPNFPKFNIKISGNNKVTYNKYDAKFIEITGHGNFNILGNGILNVKFKDTDEYSGDRSAVIAGNGSNIIYDGPTLTVDKAWISVIITCYNRGEPGDLIIKSGNIIVNEYVDYHDYYFPVFISTSFDMTGGNIYINYVNYSKDLPSVIFESFHCYGKMQVTGGKIVITGDKEVLEKLNPVAAYTGMKYIEETSFIMGDCIDITKLDATLEKDIYEYDGKAKTPKVYIYGYKEGVDFKVSYSNNVKIGTAKVSIVGLGRLKGSKEITFKIIKGTTKVGSKISDGKLIYRVTKTGTNDGKIVGKVTVIGLKKKSLKKVSIKSQLSKNGINYKITAIEKKAFKKGKNLKSIVVGKNVSKISKGAFIGCKKLKYINIKTKKIKKFVKGTFKGVKNTCVIKLPKAKKKVYTKKIKKSGFKGIIK